MSPNDGRHGLTAGYYAGCRGTCCREAINAYERRRRKSNLLRNAAPLRLSALGSRRRIEALMYLGWTAEEIAAECGWTKRGGVLSIRHQTWVRPDTAARVAEAFERMSMKTPPPRKQRKRTRRHAARVGWAPPLAWDDIDDPNERPKGVLKVA